MVLGRHGRERDAVGHHDDLAIFDFQALHQILPPKSSDHDNSRGACHLPGHYSAQAWTKPIAEDSKLGTMNVQNCWHTEKTGYTHQNQFPHGASAKRHMDVRNVHAAARARDGQRNQATKEVERHFPKCPRPVRIENAHFDVRQAVESGEEISRHAAHPAATFDPARRYIHHSNRLVQRSRHGKFT